MTSFNPKSLHPEVTKRIADGTTAIFWFRRDLRIQDNTGLYYALKENKSVLPVFIFDNEILDKLEDKADKRVEFIHQSLQLLKVELEKMGSSLWVLHGKPIDIYEKLQPLAVYTNHDYEPYALERDEAVKSILKQKDILFKTFKDQVIFEKDEVVKDDGKPYTIFTPYSKKWKAALNKFYLKSYPTEKFFDHFKKIHPLPLPTVPDGAVLRATTPVITMIAIMW